jgi:fumarate reductase flavoprotein subunit
VKSETCLKCHGDAEKLAMKTAAVRPNPHDSHLGDAACEQCHHSHKPSEDACSKCHHFGFKVP